MVKLSSFQFRAGIILTVILIIALIGMVNVHSEAGTDKRRSDIVTIDLPALPGGEQMPAVQFFHDLHTETLKGKKDCKACHQQKDNQLVFKFKRLEDSNTNKDMNIYHDNCIDCHKETADVQYKSFLLLADNRSGPVSGDCRSCHNSSSKSGSSRQPVSFDKSLHYRHESAKLIKPINATDEVNCSACHHKYDKDAKKTIYKKGEEEACGYCHKPQKTPEASSIRSASHNSCVNCHQQLADQSQKAGPVNCKGCHDSAEQKKIKVVESVPRLKRNQPDSVLLASWLADSDISEETLKRYMKPVAFNHKGHEEKALNCRTCHHESLQRCGECHTETGDEKGGYISLEQAMHSGKTEKSCMGCHKEAKTAKNCAGCHTLMPDKDFTEVTCSKCHAADKGEIGSMPMNDEKKMELAKKTLDAASILYPMVSDELIPEEVTIKVMVDKYDGAVFPHRKMIHKLASGIKENKMAEFFHGEKTTLCMGCHHNSPASTQPPKCASCHGKPFKTTAQDGRPGLKGAYHGQCISCHQVMKIEKPAATDCTECHKKRTIKPGKES